RGDHYRRFASAVGALQRRYVVVEEVTLVKDALPVDQHQRCSFRSLNLRHGALSFQSKSSNLGAFVNSELASSASVSTDCCFRRLRRGFDAEPTGKGATVSSAPVSSAPVSSATVWFAA